MYYLIKRVQINPITTIYRNASTSTSQYWLPTAFKRLFCNEATPEDKLKSLLSSSFPGAKSVDVYDVSGGCGAMYEIYVEAPQFKGLTIVKQHKLVTEALKEQIKDMHGVRISTSPT